MSGSLSVNGSVASITGVFDNLSVDDYDLDASDLPSHGHSISDITNLQSELNGKANSSHNHSASDVTSGQFSTTLLGIGTGTSANFLRGNGLWSPVFAWIHPASG